MRSWLTGCCLMMAVGPVLAATPSESNSSGTYALQLLEQVSKAHPELLGATISAIPPKAAHVVVVASTEQHPSGAPADPADIAVIQTNTPPKVDASGTRAVVRLPLRDVSGDTVGSLHLTYAYQTGADVAAITQSATQIRDRLQRRISHAGNLFDPFPYEPDAPPADSYAQQLVDEILAAHPEVEILAIHATAPESDYNIIVGSNIGRLGKKADNDDMRCFFTGKPNLEVNSTGKRFESEMQLHDRAGQLVGVVGIVVAYKKGDNKQALFNHATQVRVELEKKIPDAASLFRSAGSAAPLTYGGRTELPGYSGDFDHFAVDIAGNRLFLAAEDHGTLEVFDLKSGQHLKTVKGFETPHSVFPIPQSHRLLVTDGSESVKLLDYQTLAPVGSIKLHPGADSIGFDGGSGHLYIVTGGKDVKLKESWLEEIDPVAAQKISEVHFDADHVEALAVQQGGPHVYINVTDKNDLAVIDKVSHKIVARWPIKEAEQNALVQLDEATHRLFVVTRKPGKMLVLDADSGATLAQFAAPGRVDQEIFDPASHRVYAPGGEGYIGVYTEQDANHFVELAHVPSAAGAKTAILVPELHRLYVAVSPGEGKTGAALIWFDVNVSAAGAP
jgi:hypothetical protein